MSSSLLQINKSMISGPFHPNGCLRFSFCRLGAFAIAMVELVARFFKGGSPTRSIAILFLFS
jgi:hypothetical protein